MFKILAILAIGVAISLAFIKVRRKVNENSGTVMTVVVWLMLWAFGADIGSDAGLMAQLPLLGAQALMLGVGAMICSAVACMLLQRLTIGLHSIGNQSCGNAGFKGLLKAMRGSLLTVGFFAVGILCGRFLTLPSWLDTGVLSEWLLYVLIAFVGLSLGPQLQGRMLQRSANVRTLLIAPVSILGTVAAGVIAGLIPWGYGVADSIAGVSGMAYYSLSSLLISQLKIADLGVDGALQLGAVALLGNLVRELSTLLFAPFIGRKMGAYALIGAAGVTSLDVCMPAITKNCGPESMAPSLVNGLTLEVLCPLLVTAACAL